ncbi:MAG: histidine utilization repressor [Gammaproteobacteria bacterium]
MSSRLDLSLVSNDARPKYQQIKDLVRQRIRAGHWSAGRRLPSENEWVDRLGVSRMTVNRALRELQQEGHVERVHGVGTFVAAPVAHASLIELKDIAQEIEQRGRSHRAHVVRLRLESASRALAEQLELAAGAEVFRAVLVHFDNDVPIQVEDRVVNPALAPKFLDQDFAVVTPTAYLMKRFRPDEMEHRVQAVTPDAALAKRLQIERDEPCLRLTRRTFIDGRVVTHVALTYPGSRYDLVARYSTD